MLGLLYETNWHDDFSIVKIHAQISSAAPFELAWKSLDLKLPFSADLLWEWHYCVAKAAGFALLSDSRWNLGGYRHWQWWLSYQFLHHWILYFKSSSMVYWSGFNPNSEKHCFLSYLFLSSVNFSAFSPELILILYLWNRDSFWPHCDYHGIQYFDRSDSETHCCDWEQDRRPLLTKHGSDLNLILSAGYWCVGEIADLSLYYHY